MGPTGLNQALNEGFCHFIEFGSNVSLEIATSSRNKTHEKNYGDGKVDKFGHSQNRAEIRFLAIFDHFLKFVSLVFLKIA